MTGLMKRVQFSLCSDAHKELKKTVHDLRGGTEMSVLSSDLLSSEPAVSQTKASRTATGATAVTLSAGQHYSELADGHDRTGAEREK